ncbi:hypothetical protein STEG23_016724 [Scotinomys teguina]
MTAWGDMGVGYTLKDTRPVIPFMIAPSVLVSIFLAPSLALMNTNDSHPLDGSVGTQTIHVDALRCMVSIQDTNVLSEWNGIMSYKNALLAVKLFSKMACVLAKMDLAVFPSLDDITQALGKQKGHEDAESAQKEHR